MNKNAVTNVFILGSKGIPAKYGGFETFVDNLVQNNENPDLKYHVACLSDNSQISEYCGARCFNIKVPNVGGGKVIIYDLLAVKNVIKYIKNEKKNGVENNNIIYFLGCKLGPLLSIISGTLKKHKIITCINPDGLEWKRAKWSFPIRKYLKISESFMVKSANWVVCDSQGIKDYITEEYNLEDKSKFIAYGADTNESTCNKLSDEVSSWYNKFQVKDNNYFLIVGRFVPENNYELIIREFMTSDVDKDLVIITNHENDIFYDTLQNKYSFLSDDRIKFVGTVYDQNLLKYIRTNSFAYIHGHEVGGTNPSLLESLQFTNVNLLLDVNFNREVGGNSSLFFNKINGDLSNKITEVNNLELVEILKLGKLSKQRISDYYNWPNISSIYDKFFMEECINE